MMTIMVVIMIMTVLMGMFTRMVMRVMARNSCCQVSVFTLTNTRVEMNRITTKHKDHSSLDVKKPYIIVLQIMFKN